MYMYSENITKILETLLCSFVIVGKVVFQFKFYFWLPNLCRLPWARFVALGMVLLIEWNGTTPALVLTKLSGAPWMLFRWFKTFCLVFFVIFTIQSIWMLHGLVNDLICLSVLVDWITWVIVHISIYICNR